jgi:hypothetical protein
MSKPKPPVYITKERLPTPQNIANLEIDETALKQCSEKLKAKFNNPNLAPLMLTFIELE